MKTIKAQRSSKEKLISAFTLLVQLIALLVFINFIIQAFSH